MDKSPTFIAVALGLLMGLAAPVFAQERHDNFRHEREQAREPAAPRPPAERPLVRPNPPRLGLDQRYHHDHYYPRPGVAMAALPARSVSIGFHGGNWFLHGGVWFRPVGSRFVVALPPIGIVTPLLPPDVVSLWIGGAPYYYANDVYYAPAPGQGYVVVAPPPGAETVQPVAAAPAGLPEPIVYPRAGQSAAQTDADLQDCRRWAATQPGAPADASVFQRAVAACMEGRGYTVR